MGRLEKLTVWSPARTQTLQSCNHKEWDYVNNLGEFARRFLPEPLGKNLAS